MDFMYRKCYFINQKDFIQSDDDNPKLGGPKIEAKILR